MATSNSGLNPCDFCFRGHLKRLVYETAANTVQGLANRIMNAAAEIGGNPDIIVRLQPSLIWGVATYLTNGGRQVEQLI